MLAVSREPCLTGTGSRLTVDEEGRDASVSATMVHVVETGGWMKCDGILSKTVFCLGCYSEVCKESPITNCLLSRVLQ